MSVLRRVVLNSVFADGTLPAAVRLSLLAAAAAILTLGLWRLPEIATTHGEMVIGVLLSVSVALQMFVAALFFPLGMRRR